MLKRLVIAVLALIVLAALGVYAGNALHAWQRTHAVGRNMILNGDFDRWAARVPVTVDYHLAKTTADGWLATADGAGGKGQAEFSRGVLNVYGQGPLPYLRWKQASDATAGTPSLAQTIPGAGTLAGQNAVLSFYARSDTPLRMAATLVQHFGAASGRQVSADRVAAVVRFALDTHWTPYSLPMVIPAVNNVVMGDSGTDVLWLSFLPDQPHAKFTLDITQVQLEPGRTPTPFELRQPVVRKNP